MFSESTLWFPPPPPPTKLGRYRTLSPLAGVRVSPLQLGAMSIGDQWQNHGMGSMDKESSFKLLDAYFDAGVSSASPLFSLLSRSASNSCPGKLYRHCKQLACLLSSYTMTTWVTSSDCVISQDETSEALLASGLRSTAYAVNLSSRLRYSTTSSLVPLLVDVKTRQYTTGFKRGQDQITHKINYAGIMPNLFMYL
jgi:hypothetical protein